MVDPQHRAVSPAYLGALVFSAAVFIRLAVSLHPYSGAGKAPMFGDYEAQRHWMEITYNLPITEWYVNSSRNDLNYWGLDYPPLTAYHSWVCGAVATCLNPDWVALNVSRGYESYEHKLYMRYTVLVADVLIFFTAVLCYISKLGCGHQRSRVHGVGMTYIHKAIFSFLLLLQPSLVLIDHGHFQYNCASLGLALWGVLGILTNHDLLGSLAFSLALNYKQMELYHAMPFFCYLLGKSVYQSRHAGNLEKVNWQRVFFAVTKLGMTVLLTFSVCWAPFIVLSGDLEGGAQVLRRLFPFGRGLYEDKVANFWCSISLVLKVRQLFSTGFLINLSLVVTLVALLPSSIGLLRKPTPYHFLLTLVNSSLSFFLFSFQVHEKSILLATLPVSLLTAHHPYFSLWFNLVATFSMYPLLVKDGLALATWALSGLFVLASYLVLPPSYHVSQKPHWMKRVAVCCSPLPLLLLCLLSHVVPPPLRLPDIFPVLISSYSCALFLLSYLYCNWLQLFPTGSLFGGHDPNLQLQLHCQQDSSLIAGGYLFGGGDMYWSTRTSIRVSPPLRTDKLHAD